MEVEVAINTSFSFYVAAYPEGCVRVVDAVVFDLDDLGQTAHVTLRAVELCVGERP
jgi:hypothetical protein